MRSLPAYLNGWQDGWALADCQRYRAVTVLDRLPARERDICELSFEPTFAEHVPHKLFRFRDCYWHSPKSLDTSHSDVFRSLPTNGKATDFDQWLFYRMSQLDTADWTMVCRRTMGRRGQARLGSIADSFRSDFASFSQPGPMRPRPAGLGPTPVQIWHRMRRPRA